MSKPCKPQKFSQDAPSDEACEKAWDQIMAIARDHCLIIQAYGGVATLAIPQEQRRGDCRETVLQAHQRNETTEVKP
jgi:hypothetical protein